MFQGRKFCGINANGSNKGEYNEYDASKNATQPTRVRDSKFLAANLKLLDIARLGLNEPRLSGLFSLDAGERHGGYKKCTSHKPQHSRAAMDMSHLKVRMTLETAKTGCPSREP